MRIRATLLGLLLSTPGWSAPNVLSNTDHAASFINTAVSTVLGAGVVDVSVLTDETSTDNGGASFLTGSAFVSAGRDTGRTNFQIANNATSRNNAPYTILTQSSLGYSLSLDESLYTSLYNVGVNSILYLQPQVYPTAAVSPPPIGMANIIAPLSANPNNGAGGGTEFAMSAAYKGFDTSFSSNVAALFAGLLAAVSHNHPSWTVWDLKGAFRQTASKWATGWNADYGNINYDNATAIASSSAIFLQPPLLLASSTAVNQLTLTIYPFRQTRRHHEVVYLIPVAYAWPIKNEYVTADITASGGTLVYTSNGTDVIPTATVSFSVAPGRYNLVAFTTDNAGAFSRHEIWSDTAVMGQCL
jgi:hypothetical protein